MRIGFASVFQCFAAAFGCREIRRELRNGILYPGFSVFAMLPGVEFSAKVRPAPGFFPFAAESVSGTAKNVYHPLHSVIHRDRISIIHKRQPLKIRCVQIAQRFFRQMKQKAQAILCVLPSIFGIYDGKRSSKMSAGEFLEVPKTALLGSAVLRRFDRRKQNEK